MASAKQARLKLTDAQRAQLKAEFGHDVEELQFHVEEFPVSGSKDATLRVLKVNNVAKVLSSGVSGVVN